MSESGMGRHGGVYNTGAINTGGGNVIGGDVSGGIQTVSAPSPKELSDALNPLLEAIKGAPPEIRTDAEAKLNALKKEVSKGKTADDGVIAKLVDGFVGLVPTAVSAIVSAFTTPVLGSITGPVTKFVLDKLRGE
jgi:hypothetical protein